MENKKEKFEQQYLSFNCSEEVYGQHYDTAGNFHWYGTKTGHHVIYQGDISND